TDSRYQARSHNLFIVAVNCTVVGGTCFCASMQTGPKATAGYDLAVTEILEADRHYFVVEAGTDAGMEVLNQIPHQTADPAETTRVDALMTQSASQMGRTLNTENIKDLLYRNSESPIWEAIAQRCLTCANCTLVCPTCFCSTVEDVTDLTGDIAERWRRWDSCFTVEFSYIHGGPVRSSPESRYRQWMTHKLASWIDQFGTSGCVGCGRCITWCPVGIDITKEVQTIRESEK
ncbi:MAG TPA: 4Fe-4S dicluster domain-containing protein, partial [Acidobacteriota bacterium]|nr:4Fe-4S dicluster domain-containing protein [Acidobacteriota bacterium]